MDYLGDKLTVAQTHMNQWMSTVRRSLHEALNLVTTAVTHERTSGEGGSRTPLKRTSSFRHFASRSRESLRRFSVRSQQRFSSLRKRQSCSDSLDPDQLKQCFTRPSPVTKDTDTLVREADSQYGTWSGEGDEDSYLPMSPSPDNAASTRKQPSLSSPTEVDSHDSTSDQRHRSLDRSSVEMDSADSTEKQVSASPSPAGEAVDFSFLDQTSVLDSSALKNRVQLSRRSQRRAPTYHSQRRSKVLQDKQLTIQEDTDSTWMFKDSTEEKPKTQEDSAEEDKPQRPTVQPQRLPVFPGMDPSVLKAQLRKKRESDSTSDASGSAKLLKSPKSPLQQGVLGGRPLPSPTEENGPEAESPQWLKELKSKKRQSQYENEV